jgi:NADP-dependent 3-hydroxy acid dehydrogenase YdfG
MNPIQAKRIIITGASSGIGEATALKLAAAGHQLMLGARRADRLGALVKRIREEGGNADFMVTDVASRNQVEALVAGAVAHYGSVDVMINNAGLMPLSFFSQCKVDEWEKMIDINIKGVLYGIAAVLPRFKAQLSGHIINIASVAGHTVFPTGGVYCATKHAVRALTEGLRQEEPLIRTTLISPGAVATELPSGISDKRIAMATQAAYADAISPEIIADAILWAIRQPPTVDINEIIVRPVNQRA